MKRKIWLLALIGAVLLSGNPLWAGEGFYVVAVGAGVGTKITSLPYTITQPGFYYLGGNLTCRSNIITSGITIDSNDVTLDLMGFRLRGTGDAVRSTTGVRIINARNNIEVRNGSLRELGAGVMANLSDGGADNVRVINIRSDATNFAISLAGYNHLVKGCTISNGAVGIYVNGSGMVSANVVNHMSDRCIEVRGVATVTGNTISNGSAFVLDFAARGSIIGNTISCDSTQTGLSLPTNTSLPVLVSQNSVTGLGTPKSGGNAKIFYVGNLGLTNTNSFLAP